MTRTRMFLVCTVNSVLHNSHLLDVSYLFTLYILTENIFSRKETFPLNKCSLLNRFYELCNFASLCGNSICCKWAQWRHWYPRVLLQPLALLPASFWQRQPKAGYKERKWEWESPYSVPDGCRRRCNITAIVKYVNGLSDEPGRASENSTVRCSGLGTWSSIW